MGKKYEALTEINELLQLCEVMRQDILANENKYINYKNPTYAIYKEKVVAFVQKHNIEKLYREQYSLINEYYYNSRTWSLNLKEIDILAKVILELKQKLCKDAKNKIFISHSEKDKTSVDLFIELLHAIGVPHPTQNTEEKYIFCSSHLDYYIENGYPNKNKVKTELQNQDTFFVLWYTDNYFNSPCCLNEVGAIWINNRDYQEILEPAFDSSKIKGLLDNQPVWFRADDKYRLNNFKTKVVEMFGIDMPSENHWEQSRDKFIKRLKELRS